MAARAARTRAQPPGRGGAAPAGAGPGPSSPQKEAGRGTEQAKQQHVAARRAVDCDAKSTVVRGVPWTTTRSAQALTARCFVLAADGCAGWLEAAEDAYVQPYQPNGHARTASRTRTRPAPAASGRASVTRLREASSSWTSWRRCRQARGWCSRCCSAGWCTCGPRWSRSGRAGSSRTRGRGG